MKLSLIFLSTIFSFSLYSQTSDVSLKHAGNDFSLDVVNASEEETLILITNKDNSNSTKNLRYSKEISEFEFVNEVSQTMEELCANYIFESDSGVQIVVDKTANDYGSFVKSIMALDDEKRGEFVFASDSLDAIYSRLFDKLKTMKKGDASVEIFKQDGYVIKVKIKDDEKVHMFDDGTGEVKFDSLALAKSLSVEFKSNENLVKYFFPEADWYDKNIDFKFSKANRDVIIDIYKKSIISDNYEFVNNYYSQNAGADSLLHEISLKQNSEQKYFKLRMCTSGSMVCEYSAKLNLTVSEPEFAVQINNLTDSIKAGNRISPLHISALYKEIYQKNQDVLIQHNITKTTAEASELIKQIQNQDKQFSGRLCLNEEVSINAYNVELDTIERRGFGKLKCGLKEGFKWIVGMRKNDNWKTKVITKKGTNLDYKIKLEYATVRMFNNRAKSIVLCMDVYDEKGVKVEDDLITTNFSHSIPLRGLTSGGGSMVIRLANGAKINVKFEDVFKYIPHESNFNYSVKNQNYRVESGDTVDIEQRNLSDFFAPVIFTDFLGLNSDNKSGVILAEGKAEIPLWIRNKGKFTYIPNISASLNTILSNGIEASPVQKSMVSSQLLEEDTLLLSRNDYLEFANVRTKIDLSLINYEMKGLSTDLSAGVGLGYHRFGLQYTQTIDDPDQQDVVSTDQFNALFYSLFLNAKIRPQSNFGADLHISGNLLEPVGSKNNFQHRFGPANFGKDRRFIHLSLDVYSKVNPSESNGGIYVRIGGYLHTNTSDFLPQILAGYTTNLESFVNKFKSE